MESTVVALSRHAAAIDSASTAFYDMSTATQPQARRMPQSRTVVDADGAASMSLILHAPFDLTSIAYSLWACPGTGPRSSLCLFVSCPNPEMGRAATEVNLLKRRASQSVRREPKADGTTSDGQGSRRGKRSATDHEARECRELPHASPRLRSAAVRVSLPRGMPATIVRRRTADLVV